MAAVDVQPKRRTLGLVEHVRLRGSNLSVQGLKVQPTDEVIADVLETIACCIIRQKLRLHAGCLDL